MSRRDQPFVDIDALEAATAGLPAPLVVVDLDAFDANAADLVRRAAGRPIRVASKSVRCRSLLRRVLDRPGFAGVMAYAVPEAVWLVRQGFTDVFVAYPSVDREWLQTLATDEQLREEISVAGGLPGYGTGTGPPVPALDLPFSSASGKEPSRIGSESERDRSRSPVAHQRFRYVRM